MKPTSSNTAVILCVVLISTTFMGGCSSDDDPVEIIMTVDDVIGTYQGDWTIQNSTTAYGTNGYTDPTIQRITAQGSTIYSEFCWDDNGTWQCGSPIRAYKSLR